MLAPARYRIRRASARVYSALILSNGDNEMIIRTIDCARSGNANRRSGDFLDARLTLNNADYSNLTESILDKAAPNTVYNVVSIRPRYCASISSADNRAGKHSSSEVLCRLLSAGVDRPASVPARKSGAVGAPMTHRPAPTPRVPRLELPAARSTTVVGLAIPRIRRFAPVSIHSELTDSLTRSSGELRKGGWSGRERADTDYRRMRPGSPADGSPTAVLGILISSLIFLRSRQFRAAADMPAGKQLRGHRGMWGGGTIGTSVHD